jgi:hypothetical protein
MLPYKHGCSGEGYRKADGGKSPTARSIRSAVEQGQDVGAHESWFESAIMAAAVAGPGDARIPRMGPHFGVEQRIAGASQNGCEANPASRRGSLTIGGADDTRGKD